jgi:hypothetical protein
MSDSWTSWILWDSLHVKGFLHVKGCQDFSDVLGLVGLLGMELGIIGLG